MPPGRYVFQDLTSPFTIGVNIPFNNRGDPTNNLVHCCDYFYSRNNERLRLTIKVKAVVLQSVQRIIFDVFNLEKRNQVGHDVFEVPPTEIPGSIEKTFLCDWDGKGSFEPRLWIQYPLTFIPAQSYIRMEWGTLPPPTVEGRVKIANTRTNESIDSGYHILESTTRLPNYFFPSMTETPLYVRNGDTIKIEFWIRDATSWEPITMTYCEADCGDANGNWGTPIPHPWPNGSKGKYTDETGYTFFEATIPQTTPNPRFAVYCWCHI